MVVAGVGMFVCFWENLGKSGIKCMRNTEGNYNRSAHLNSLWGCVLNHLDKVSKSIAAIFMSMKS